MTKPEAGKWNLISPAAQTTCQIRYIPSGSSIPKGAETGERVITDTLLREKRQEILELFSLERGQVHGGTRAACEPPSMAGPLVSPFFSAEKERDVQGRADAGDRLAQRGAQVSMQSYKHCFMS